MKQLILAAALLAMPMVASADYDYGSSNTGYDYGSSNTGYDYGGSSDGYNYPGANGYNRNLHGDDCDSYYKEYKEERRIEQQNRPKCRSGCDRGI